MSLFKKKHSVPTLQNLNQQIGKIANELLMLQHDEYNLNAQLDRVRSEVKSRIEAAGKLAEKAKELQDKIKAEVAETIKEGEDNGEAPPPQPAA